MKNNLFERLHTWFYNYGSKAGSPEKIGDLIPSLSGSNKENSQYWEWAMSTQGKSSTTGLSASPLTM